MSEASAVEQAVAATAPTATQYAHEEQFQRVLSHLRQPPRRSSGALLLVGSLAAFILFEQLGSSSTWVDIAVLLGVLFFHEAGHWLGMKLTGWRDVRMFFIPLFGAAVQGRPREASGWKEGLVLLLGPVPGIVLGAAVAFALRAPPPPELRAAIVMLLFVNAFNLLPLGLLDGGKVLQLTIFQRNRFLELGFLGLAAALLLLAAVGLREWFLGVLGAIMLLNLPALARLVSAAHRLRQSGVVFPVEARALDEGAGRAAFEAAWELLQPGQRVDEKIAEKMENLTRVGSRRPPTAFQSLALLAVGGAALLLAVVGGVALERPLIKEWIAFHDPDGAYEVLFPHKPLVALTRDESEAGRAKRWVRLSYSGTLLSIEDYELGFDGKVDTEKWGRDVVSSWADDVGWKLEADDLQCVRAEPYHGHQGFSATRTREKWIYRWIGFVRDRHAYVLLASGPANSPVPQRFLESFTLGR